MVDDIAVFDDKKIRRIWDSELGEWFFSVVDVVGVLSGSLNASNYWKVLKHRLREEGSQVVTDCNRLKLRAKDGKMREGDVGDARVILRIVQSVPSKNAEPFKLWLARVGAERLDEVVDPELSINRANSIIYKVENVSNFEIFPSDPFGSLDDFYSKVFISSGGVSYG